MAGDIPKPTLKLETSQFSKDMPPPPITATPSSENPRPILKLSTSRQGSFSGDVPTPSSEKKTIRIRVNSSQPGTPAAGVPPVKITKTVSGRSSKPTEKVIAARKRGYDSEDDEEDNAPMAGRRISKIQIRPPPTSSSKKAYTVQTPTGRLLLKPKGKPVEHKPGEAWDSEASDREEDPVRESAMIFRTLPGPSTEYLNKALEEGKIGLDKKSGGADLSIDWLDSKERRAMVTIDGLHFAAVLVDLPTIVEAMKTWDKKNFMKNMDITQMLLCFARVSNEQEAKIIALPHMVQQMEHKWPHGLTPPMHDAVNRRFRKQPSEKQLISTAAHVKRLLAEDAACVEPPKYEFLQDDDEGFEGSGEEDAEGEDVDDYLAGADEYGDEPVQEAQEDDHADLEAELMAELAGEIDEDAEGATPVTQLEAQTPMTLEATTPAAGAAEVSDADGEEEEVSDEDDDDEDDDELDEEEASKQAEFRDMKNEMLGLQKKVADLEGQMATQTNPLMRRRIHTNIDNLRKEISLRKAQLNITDDE
ncbi:putative TAFII55 protein conserved region domain-containing protein [Seiridium cardinale]